MNHVDLTDGVLTSPLPINLTPMRIYMHNYTSRFYPAKGILNKDSRLFTKITYLHI